MKSISASLIGLGIAFSVPKAQAVTVNFDDVTVSGVFQYFPSDHYRPQGIVFGSTIPINNEAPDDPSGVSLFLAGGGTLPNGLSLADPPGGPSPSSIGGSFVLPGSSTPGFTNFVQILGEDFQGGTELGLLEGFDSSGKLLTQALATTPAGGGTRLLTISAPGIASFRLSTDGDGAVFDNLTFDTPTAQPSTTNFLLGDFNRDGHVNTADIPVMLNVLSDLNPYKSILQYTNAQLLSIIDLNGDGKFTNADLQSLLSYLNAGGGSVAAVPEPSSLLLAAFGLTALVGFPFRRVVRPLIRIL